jgi:hypothetical protein
MAQMQITRVVISGNHASLVAIENARSWLGLKSRERLRASLPTGLLAIADSRFEPPPPDTGGGSRILSEEAAARLTRGRSLVALQLIIKVPVRV